MPNNNNNNNATVPANSNANNDPQGNDPEDNNNNNNAKSKSSAEGTRRVNPGTGKAKSAAQIRAAVNMKRAKTLINQKLNIKSRAHEFNPLIKILKRENFSNAAAKEAAINEYIEQLREKREAQSGTKKAKKNTAPKNTTTTNKPNKPKRKYVRKPKPNAVPVPVVVNEPSPASTATTVKKEKKKVINPSESQIRYKSNMTAAKKYLNNALSLKSMPPEYNPLVKYMRNDKLSEAERKAAMNAHVETVRVARNAKASKKNVKGGSRKSRKNMTRKNRH